MSDDPEYGGMMYLPTIREESNAANTTSNLEIAKTIPGEPRIVEHVTAYESSRLTSLRSREKNSHGRELRNGEAFLFTIPPEYQHLALDSLTLLHRKDSKYTSTDSTGYDTNGAYTRVLVHDMKSNSWISWPDPYKGRHDISRGDKFAEERPPQNPESEVLYDWIAKIGAINIDSVAVIAVGKGPKGVSNYHGIDIEFIPEDIDAKQELIFSPGTEFVDIPANILEPTYGGGMNYNGRYPHSVPIGTGVRYKDFTFPVQETGDEFYVENDQLHIKITHEYELTQVQVAVGDTEDTGEFNKDGHYGRLGWAKLDSYVAASDGTKHKLMDYVNIPPNGVLKGSPETKITVKPGDELVFVSKNDISYIMGVKIV